MDTNILWDHIYKLLQVILDSCSYLFSLVSFSHHEVDSGLIPPTSVNYHFTRKCNYSCGFCFHTAKTSFVLPLDKAMKGLKMLKEAGKCYLAKSEKVVNC